MSASGPASSRSLRGLDLFAFFLADIQTGWGPFVAAYLTAVAWSQFDIGLILSAGTLAALALQIPAGALVDRVPQRRGLAALAVAAISGSALLLAFWPFFSVVLIAKLLHAIASCLTGPLLAAISLGLVGYALLGARIGRNARYLSLGNAIAAGVMGVIGWYFSIRDIFFFTAALAIPALLSLMMIRAHEIDPDLARGGVARNNASGSTGVLRSVVGNRLLLIFAAVVLLFQVANAAMLPAMAGILATRVPETATLILSACILGPQIVVAVIAPWAGRKADIVGRRPLLMLCFLALAVRGCIFVFTSEPWIVMAAQLLDGISAASLGILAPVIAADATRGSGHFNLAQGVIGMAVGIGASISTAFAGYMADALGGGAVFAVLTGVAVAGLVLVLTAMPESMPVSREPVPAPETP